MFYRLHTDQTRSMIDLQNHWAGPTPSACWLIGGGPSLRLLPCPEIEASPIPRMAVNLSGVRLLRPTFWTSYDPSARFHRSIYLDPGVTKFLHARRAMDLVPETTFKVCECPNTFFFDRDRNRGFGDFLAPQHRTIVDWADSLVQAIDLLYRLGFRTLYLAGCDMRIRPTREQRRRAEAAGVTVGLNASLGEFVGRCRAAGISVEELDTWGPAAQYHFDEHKPMACAARTDQHYFRIAQFLRLSRRAIATAGVQLISVTPHSRLNDYFPYVPVRRVLRGLARRVGDPAAEPVRGLYCQSATRRPQSLGPMRDFKPPHWPTSAHGRRAPARVHGEDDLHGDLLVEAEGFERLANEPGDDSRTSVRDKLRLLRTLPDEEG